MKTSLIIYSVSSVSENDHHPEECSYPAFLISYTCFFLFLFAFSYEIIGVKAAISLKVVDLPIENS